MTITELIAAGRLREAIDALPDSNDKVIQSSRLKSLQRDEMCGTISFDNANRFRAQITHAVLSLCRYCDPNVSGTCTSPSQSSGKEDSLREVIREHRRRNPEIAAEAERIAREEREQRERKGRLDVARARLILAREQAERENAQAEVDRLLGEIAAFREAQAAQAREAQRRENLEIQLAAEAQKAYTLAQERELAEVMLLFAMEI